MNFPDVVAAMAGIPARSVVLDGEIVALEENGRPSFQALQNSRSFGHGCTVCFYAFDLLHLDGHSLLHLDLEVRKALLRELIQNTNIRCSETFNVDPQVLLKHAKKFRLEGIIVKRSDSKYES